MSFDNRTADRKPNPHTVVLGCVERFEEPLGGIGSETNTRVLHGELDVFAIVDFRFDQQLSRPVFDIAHRVRSAAQQIQDDLLNLDTVAFHRRQILGEFMPDQDPVAL